MHLLFLYSNEIVFKYRYPSNLFHRRHYNYNGYIYYPNRFIVIEYRVYNKYNK